MKLRPKTPLALWLVVCSFGLMLAPSGMTDSVRLSTLSLFQPFRRASISLQRLINRQMARIDQTPDEELVRKLEFYEGQIQRLEARVSDLESRNEELSTTRRVLGGLQSAILTADVVLTADTANWRRSILVAAGTRDGVRKGYPVIWHNALIGRVSETGPFSSRVVLSTDPTFKVGAVTVPFMDMEGTSLAPRDVGICEGSVDAIRLKWLTGDRDIELDTQVVTTADPHNGIPKGLLVGMVSSVSRNRGPFSHVELTPPVNVQALEFVMILIPEEAEAP